MILLLPTLAYSCGFGEAIYHKDCLKITVDNYDDGSIDGTYVFADLIIENECQVSLIGMTATVRLKDDQGKSASFKFYPAAKIFSRFVEPGGFYQDNGAFKKFKRTYVEWSISLSRVKFES